MNEVNCIAAALVPEADRLDFLPTFFGARLMMRGEGLVYDWMGELCEEYSGGLWHFYTLSNGGGYMALADAKRMRIEVAGNDFEGEMSADAAGIVATLFALGQLAAETEQDGIIRLYHELIDFAGEHAEVALIRSAID